jgi:hypothetical protein
MPTRRSAAAPRSIRRSARPPSPPPTPGWACGGGASSRIRFWGLTSRWTIPVPCRASNASKSWVARARRTAARRRGPGGGRAAVPAAPNRGPSAQAGQSRRASRSASVTPPSSSHTSHRGPPSAAAAGPARRFLRRPGAAASSASSSSSPSASSKAATKAATWRRVARPRAHRSFIHASAGPNSDAFFRMTGLGSSPGTARVARKTEPKPPVAMRRPTARSDRVTPRPRARARPSGSAT